MAPMAEWNKPRLTGIGKESSSSPPPPHYLPAPPSPCALAHPPAPSLPPCPSLAPAISPLSAVKQAVQYGDAPPPHTEVGRYSRELGKFWSSKNEPQSSENL